MQPQKPVLLLILDGWGIREMIEGNAVKLASTPNYDRWMSSFERSIVDASGEAVGLVPEQMGNSEVGHLNLGAGRVVYQDISKIDLSIRDGSFARQPALVAAMDRARTGLKVHFIGLLSDGGVHSHESHLYALLDLAASYGVNPILHLITDGRDTPTQSGIGFVQRLESYCAQRGVGRIASLCGRYYAMDRDNRWERTKQAYDLFSFGEAPQVFSTASEALQASYDSGVTDEFVKPVRIGDSPEEHQVSPGDTLIFYNFRSDRMRQLTRLYLYHDVENVAHRFIEGLHVVTFTSYEDDYPAEVVFGKDDLSQVLAEVISAHGMQQFHAAETEKYPHVTFFFNGRREEAFPGEDRLIVPSPKVATYDLKPEMSAYELTEAILSRLQAYNDDFLLVNFANPDMVGHTGSLPAAIRAVEVVDECAGRLVEAVLAKGGVAIVTADHGNCERMVELATGEPHTYHTTNPVSLFVIGSSYYALRPRGKLADVAPTVLHLLGLPKPAVMTGVSFIDSSLTP